MKKALLLLAGILFCTGTILPQIEDRLNELDENDVKMYAEPLATTLGVAFNSAGYQGAYIPKLFGFSFSIHAMAILIPDDQTKFNPALPDGYDNNDPTATIYGDEGGYYAGPNGYIVYPPGINETTIPAGFPQIGFSFMGTELLVRYLPKIDVGETKIGLVGFGISHNISQYIPLFPLDLAAQILYTKLTLEDIMDQSNIAFNVHAGKQFGVLTLYGGLQYESSTLDLNYTYRQENPVNPNDYIEQDISVSLNGQNNFRFTVGAAVQLAVIRLNTDINIGSQFAVTGGLSFVF